MSVRLQHEFTAETIGEAVELWRRLVDVHFVGVYERCELSSGSHYLRYVTKKDLTDEWITALVISDGERVELPADGGGYVAGYSAVEISLISYSDGGGNDADAANVRALQDTPGLTVSTDGHHGEGSATIVLGEMPREDGVTESLARVRHIVEIMEGLQEYPLIDDETHGAYIEELAEEAWDAWAEREVRDDVCEALSLSLPDDDAVDAAWDAADGDAVREAFYGYRHPTGEGWQAEGATSVRHPHFDAAVRHVLVRVFGRTDLQTDCESCTYGDHH